MLPAPTPIAVLATAGLFLAAGAAFANDAIGTWRTDKGQVRISECGGALCATVTGIDEPNDPKTGKPLVDARNENAALRARPIMGIAVLNGMKPAGGGVWKGSIYNPEDGKTYAATMKLEGGKLKVSGCVASVLCKTQTWTR